MALRDQPYLPLYIQDFLTDEKLMECSASTTGVYIRLMCVMHKSEKYGTILLRQKFKQTDKQISNFATQIAKHFPYDFACIFAALTELIEEKVLIIDGDFLIQKRMVKDAEISEKRATAGKKGGDVTNKSKTKDKKFATAKEVANSENEYEIEDESENVIINEELKTKKSELTLLLCEKLGYSEMRYANRQRSISDFVKVKINSIQEYEDFGLNFRSYQDYKKLSGEALLGFDGLFGKQENKFDDSKLLNENWEQKLITFKTLQPKSKFEKVADNHNAPNPYDKP